MRKEGVGEAGGGEVAVPVFVLFTSRCILPSPVVLWMAGGVSQAPLSANFCLGLTWGHRGENSWRETGRKQGDLFSFPVAASFQRLQSLPGEPDP